MTTQTEALKLALEALERIDEAMPFPVAKLAQKAIKEALAQPAVAEQHKQEPVACIEDGDLYFANEIDWQTLQKQGFAVQLLYTTPPQRKPLTDWIDPNDKTQGRFLPNIGEPVIFCCRGETYIGTHTGGGFKDAFDEENYFNTWSCRWMPIPIPAAHGIKE